METAMGKSILGQIAFGRLRFLRRPEQDVTEFSQLNREEEVHRFHTAQSQAVGQLTTLYEQAVEWIGEGLASIFAIHAILLQDEELESAVRSMIRERGVTAEYAVQAAGERFSQAFDALESTYMQARAMDIRDICHRMIRLLLGHQRYDPLREGPAILVADKFFPSEVLDLDHRRLLGLIARQGSVDSHTAMLLRAYGIPAMAEVELGPEWDGHLALLDGFDHRLYLEPDGATLERLRLRYQAGGMPPSEKDKQKEKQPQTV